MLTRNSDLLKKVEALGKFYLSNIANPYLRPEFALLTLSKKDWAEIENLTERFEMFRFQGYFFDDLYLKLLALARFLKQARVQLLPVIRGHIAAKSSNRPPQEKLKADLSAMNFESNLSQLSERVKEIYTMTTSEDKDLSKGNRPIYQTMPELKDFADLLG
jgi:hypothetical protein